MFTLRCTRRLLTRLKASTRAESPVLTTRLGDWYANLLQIGRQQLVLAISERTFLPVVIPAAPASSIAVRFVPQAGLVLREIGIAPGLVEQELAEMADVRVSTTASRQVTGMMVDLARLLEAYVEGESSLLAVTLKLARTPCSPLDKTAGMPDRETRALFASG